MSEVQNILRPDNRLLGLSSGDFSLYGGQPDPAITISFAQGTLPAAIAGSPASETGAAAGPAAAPAPVALAGGDTAPTGFANASPSHTTAAPTAFAAPSNPAPPSAPDFGAALAPSGASSLPNLLSQPVVALSSPGDGHPVAPTGAPSAGDLSAGIAGVSALTSPTLAAPAIDHVGAISPATIVDVVAEASHTADALVGVTAAPDVAVAPVAPVAAAVAGVADASAATVESAAATVAEVAAPVTNVADSLVAPAAAVAEATAAPVVAAVEAATAPVAAAVEAVAAPITDTVSVVDHAVAAPIATVTETMAAAADSDSMMNGSNPAGGIATLVDLVSTSELFTVGQAQAAPDAPDASGSIVDDLIGDGAMAAPLLGEADHHDSAADHLGDTLHGL